MVILNGENQWTKVHMSESWGDTVILANGLFPRSRHCLQFLDKARRVICCDGAVDKILSYGRNPDVIVGDMDSISEESKRVFSSILHPSKDQDSNDLTKAVHYCIEQKYQTAIILGATGLREDHTLGNISLMLEYHPHIEVRIRSDFGEFFLLTSGMEVPCSPGEKISFFSLNNQLKVSSTGLKYHLKQLPLTHWYTATLNETTGSFFRLDFDSGQALIVYRALD